MPFKVAVIDYTHILYPILLKIKDIEIVLLYGPTNVDSDTLKKFELGNIKYFNNNSECIRNWNKSFVSKEDVVKYRSTQLKVERYAQRHNMIPSYATSQYFHALAFWNYHLCKKSIDCLLITNPEHGTLIDSVPIDVAKSKDIPVFQFDTLYGNVDYGYMGINCKNTGEYVKLSEIDPTVSLLDFNNVLSPSYESNPYVSHLLDILDNNSLVSNKAVKIITAIAKKMIILHSKICVSFLTLIGRPSNPYLYYKKDINIVVMIYALLSSYRQKFYRNKQYAAAMEVEHPYKDLLHNIRYLSALKRYYRKNSIKYVDPKIDGILYALHFEPEASIMNRAVYSAQIYNIEMLSAILPKGWKLFVKEHPHQFRINGYAGFYLYKQIPIYRRKEYYDRLLEIPNVELVDDRISSSDLIDPKKYPNIHAISTISGTISMESICSGKPVILFGTESTVYDNISGIYNVSDISSLKDAINDIALGNALVDPKDITKITEYLIEFSQNTYSTSSLHISENALLTLIANSKKIAQISE